MSTWKHPNDMTREELQDLVSDLSWMSLDLAQHLQMTEDGLEPEDQPTARENAIAMAYGLAQYPYDSPNDHASREASGEVELAFFGGSGLERKQFGYDELARTADELEDGTEAIAAEVNRDRDPAPAPTRDDPEITHAAHDDDPDAMVQEHPTVEQLPDDASVAEDTAAAIAQTERTLADIRGRIVDREQEARSDQLTHWHSEDAARHRHESDARDDGDST